MTKAKKVFRLVTLVLVLLTSPFACVGMGSIVFSLATGQTSGLFTAVTNVENQTGDTVYITPVTTTYEEPRVISQFARLRYTNLKLRSGDTIRLSFDAADNAMDGLIVCRENGECRYFQHEWKEFQVITEFDSLPQVNEDILGVVGDSPEYNFVMLIMTGFALTPIALLALWWRLGKSEASEV